MMKQFKYVMGLLVLALVMLGVQSCSHEPKPTEQQPILCELSGLNVQADGKALIYRYEWSLYVVKGASIRLPDGALCFELPKQYELSDGTSVYKLIYTAPSVPELGRFALEQQLDVELLRDGAIYRQVPIQLRECWQVPTPLDLASLRNALPTESGFKSRFDLLNMHYKRGEFSTASLCWTVEVPKNQFLPAWKQGFDKPSKFIRPGVERELYCYIKEEESPTLAKMNLKYFIEPSKDVFELNRILQYYTTTGKSISRVLRLSRDAASSYTVNRQVYSVKPSGKGWVFDGAEALDVLFFKFLSSDGVKLHCSGSVRKEGVSRYLYFNDDLPTCFQVEFYQDVQSVQVPCSFCVPCPKPCLK